MLSFKFPTEVIVQMKREDLVEDMDGYDPDALDEEAIDPLDIEVGNSMESFDVDSMEELHVMMKGEYRDFVLSHDGLAEEYSDWVEARNAK